jgi:hypothetical protein
MPNDIDKQIRLASKPVITSSYPTAVVFPWNALSHNLLEWPGMFRTTDGKTHGWIIKRSDTNADWKSFLQRDRRKYEYDWLGFYGFRPGKEGDNSDDEWGEICDTIYENLKPLYNLGLDGIVERHDLLQYRTITTINCGEETLHFAQGRLTVHLCC